jgi:hypothetical protein
VIAAIDSDGGPFNLFEFVLGPDNVAQRQLTYETGGAIWPDVSADGSMLVFVGYTEKGFDLFTSPYYFDVNPVQPSQPAAARNPLPPAPPASEGATTYRPWPTLLPRAWTPVLVSDGDQFQAGVSTGGSDVLGYHAYSASLLWRLTGPDAVGVPSSASPDWSIAYVYDRWRPRPFVSASRSTSFFSGASAVGDRPSTLDERTVEAGLFLPFRTVRRTQRLLFSGLRSATTISRLPSNDVFTRVAGRAAWSVTTARVYGYSVSQEDGISAGVTGEAAGTRAGDLDRSTTLTADFRTYLPGLRRNQVLAARLAGGESSGPREYGRTFRLGGATSSPDVMDFGRGAFSLLRGFPPDTFAGRRIVVVNLDYRAPLARIERGVGTWPVFVRTIHGAVFADIANAWTGTFDRRHVKTSFGAEVAIDVVAGYALPFTIVAGAARGHDGAGLVDDATTTYVRIGRAF